MISAPSPNAGSYGLPVALLEWTLHELGQCSIDDLFHDRVLHLVPEVGRLENFGPYFVVFDFLEYDAIDREGHRGTHLQESDAEPCGEQELEHDATGKEGHRKTHL